MNDQGPIPATVKPNPLQLASVVAAKADLVNIEFVSGHFRLRARGVKLDRISMDSTQSVDISQRDNISVVVAMRLFADEVQSGRALKDTTLAEPVLAIDAELRLQYRLPAESEFSQDEALAFGKINGVYNCWTYWREYVASACSRLGIPPVVLPLLKVDNAVAFAGFVAPRNSAKKRPPTKK